MEPIRIDEFCSARFVHHLCFSPNGERALLTASTAPADRRGPTRPHSGGDRGVEGPGQGDFAAEDRLLEPKDGRDPHRPQDHHRPKAVG